MKSSSGLPSKKKKDDNQSLKTSAQSNDITNYTTSTPPSTISTLATVISINSAWPRYSDHNSGTIKLKGDHVLFLCFDVTQTLERSTCNACKKSHEEYYEMKHRDFYLHSVTNYIQEVGVVNITCAGLHKA